MHIRLAAALNDRTKNNPCPTDQLSTDSELVKVAFYKDTWMDQLPSMHKCLCRQDTLSALCTKHGWKISSAAVDDGCAS